MDSPNSKGFIHISNVFTKKSIDILTNFYVKYNFNELIHYDIVSEENFKANINKLDIDEIIDNFRINDKQESMGMDIYLSGKNFYVNNDNREVIQLSTNLNNGLQLFRFVKKEGTEEKFAFIFDRTDIQYVLNFMFINMKYIDNLLTGNNVLYKYLRGYNFIDSKIFINKPGCKNQEIHCDSPNENNLLLLVPLSDCDDNSGTTVLFDNEIVAKYLKPNLYKLGNFESDEMKEDFSKSEYKKPFKIGDAIIYNTKTFHYGSQNISDKNRMFLSILFEKKEVTNNSQQQS